MKPLTSNRELYDYLVCFSGGLECRGLMALSETLAFAGCQASSSSTEFLGESRIALRRVLDEENGVLTSQDRTDLLDVLKQLDEALG